MITSPGVDMKVQILCRRQCCQSEPSAEFQRWRRRWKVNFHSGCVTTAEQNKKYGKTEKNGRRPHYRNEECENDTHAIRNDIDHNG